MINTNGFPIYIKWGQVKIEWGVSRRGRKRDRETERQRDRETERQRDREKQINKVRDGALKRLGNGVGWKWHLSISNESDEWNKYNVNEMGYK